MVENFPNDFFFIIGMIDFFYISKLFICTKNVYLHMYLQIIHLSTMMYYFWGNPVVSGRRRDFPTRLTRDKPYEGLKTLYKYMNGVSFYYVG